MLCDHSFINYPWMTFQINFLRCMGVLSGEASLSFSFFSSHFSWGQILQKFAPFGENSFNSRPLSEGCFKLNVKLSNCLPMIN